MIPLPQGLCTKIGGLLSMIAQMKPGFEIYEFAREVTKEFLEEMEKND